MADDQNQNPPFDPLQAALAHIAGGGSISVQGPQPAAPPNPAAMMPPPPPPPMNFTDFATRPENGMAIQGALSTQKGQPTPFNHPPQPGAPSPFSPTPNLYPLSQPSAMPPQLPPSNTPAAAPAIPASVGAATPNAPQLPSVQTPKANLGLMTQDEFFQAHPEMAAHPMASTPLGKALLFLTSGLAGAAGGLHGDPLAGLNYAEGVGTYNRSIPDINQQRYEQGAVKPFQQQLQNEDTQSQIGQRNAQTQLDTAKTLQIPQNAQASLAKSGLKQVTDENGNINIVPDEDSPVYQRQQAQTEYIGAHQQLLQAQTELAQSKNDPSSPAFKIAQTKLQQAQQRMSIATQRLSLSQKEFQMHAYGTDMQGNPLPGSLLLDDGTPVGSVNAANVRPTGGQRDSAGRATTLDALSQELQEGLKDPEIQAHLGPIAGRLAEVQGKIGNLPPKVAKFYNDLKSYGAFLSGFHPVKGIGALNYFDEVMVGLHQTPEQLAAKLASNATTGSAVQGVGNPRVAGGKAQQSPKKQSPLSGPAVNDSSVRKFNQKTGRLE